LNTIHPDFWPLQCGRKLTKHDFSTDTVHQK
jgi:hypothetical protein